MTPEITSGLESIKENSTLTYNHGLMFAIKTLLGPFLVFVATLYSPLGHLMQTMKSPGLCPTAVAISVNATMP